MCGATVLREMETMLWRCWHEGVEVKCSDRGVLELVMEAGLGTRSSLVGSSRDGSGDGSSD